MRLRAAMLILGFATCDAWVEPVQSYDSYKSWLIACDNTLTCVAKGFAEDAATRAELRIERAAGPRGALSATINAEARFTLAEIAVDGIPAGLSTSDWTLSSGADATRLASDHPEAVRSFVASLRNGATLTLGQSAEVPLDGLTAALLRMDERQGRAGGVTAFVAGGQASANHVPPAPAVPRIPNHPVKATLTTEEAVRLVAGVRASQGAVFAAEECQTDGRSSEPMAYALDASLALVLMPCLMGAYQGSSLAFTVSRADGTARRLTAPTPYQGGGSDHEAVDLFTEGDFNPATGTLFMAARGRGLADCGMAASWIWNGAAFDLSALSFQQSCGGVEPGDWPTLFRSIQ